MSFERSRATALNYAPCHYENSRLLFRGPLRRLDVDYVATIGGTETYGKFIKTPFPALLEQQLGLACVNFGIANAGVDVFSSDRFLATAANRSQVTVLQIVGAHNLSNRFYTVHPRRNDRFVKASTNLRSLYPEVDFSEFHFTRHMLSVLYDVSCDRFALVRRELQTAWVARMKHLCQAYQGHVVLLWFADHPPPQDQVGPEDPSKATDPLFITAPMLKHVMACATSYQQVVPSAVALRSGTDGMVFDEMDALAAQRLLGPKAHAEAAAALAPVVQDLLQKMAAP